MASRVRLLSLLLIIPVVQAMPEMPDSPSSPHLVVIHGAQDPEAIPVDEMVQSFLGRASHSPPMDLSLEDSRVLADFAYRECRDSSSHGEAVKAVRTPENLASPASAGRAMNRAMASMREQARVRWEALLNQLSEAARNDVQRYVRESVLPRMTSTRVDFEGLWTEFPERFEHWANPPTPAEQEAMLERYLARNPELRPPTDAGSAPRGPARLEIAHQVLHSGMPEWDVHCVGRFARWIEPALVGRFAAEHSLDDSLEGVESFVERRVPQALAFEGIEESRAMLENRADALQAVLDGMSPEEAHERFELGQGAASRWMWLRQARLATPHTVEEARAAAAEMTREARRAEVLSSEWTRHAYWEDQFVRSQFPPDDDAKLMRSRDGLRSCWVLEHLEPARAIYVRFAEEVVAGGPEGWTGQLNFLRFHRGNHPHL